MNTILLLSPATPGFDHGLFAPLSLPTLAGAIPDNWQVRIIDENNGQVDFDADIVAISAHTYAIRRAYELAREFRRRSIPVVLGGNHPTILTAEASCEADAVVAGEGETVWPGLLRDFLRKQLKPIYSPSRYSFDRDILPRRDLLSSRYRFASIETVRGCPFQCDFCSVARFHGARYRYKPLSLVDRELRMIRGKTLFLVDDNVIGVGREAQSRAAELFALLKDHGMRWMGQASVNIADNERLLRLAGESGCLFLFIGFESLDPEVLKDLNKGANLRRNASDYATAVRRMHDNGISVMGSFIVGTDRDTVSGLGELKRFIAQSQIDIPILHHLTPYPGTRLYERMVRDNRLIDERFWLQDPLPVFTFQPERISIDDLRRSTLDMIEGFTGVRQASWRFVQSLKNTRSLRIASFSTAATLISSRILQQRLLRSGEGIARSTYPGDAIGEKTGCPTGSQVTPDPATEVTSGDPVRGDRLINPEM